MKARLFIPMYVILALLVFCSKDSITNSNSGEFISLTPSIVFKNGDTQVAPDSVVTIVLTIIYENVTISDTFNFSDHAGSIRNIPVNTPFTFRIDGLDQNGVVVYSGQQSYTGASKT